MDVIELECPHCGDALELDAAFAGGVCRCSTCGTLMTVPADPSRDRAETVTRRDRPDAPAGGRPDAPAARPDVPGARPGARPDVPGARPDVPGSRPARADAPTRPPSSGRDQVPPAAVAASALPAEPAEDDLYITASGKSLKLAEAVVPTARKRKKVIRATVIGAFVALVLVLVGVIILAINLLVNTGEPKNTGTPEIIGIDPAVNPIHKAEPNILGIPIAGESAIIVDGTNFAKYWYPMMREIIGHEVSLAPGTDFLIIPWTDLTPKSFPSATPEKIGRDKLSALDNFLAVSNSGTASPTPFVELGLAARADQILLISGRKLESAEVTSLTDAISKRVDTRVDVVTINVHDPALKELAEANTGRYVSVSTDQLTTWYEAWKKGDGK